MLQCSILFLKLRNIVLIFQVFYEILLIAKSQAQKLTLTHIRGVTGYKHLLKPIYDKNKALFVDDKKFFAKKVDSQRCISSGSCYSLDPVNFEAGEK